MNIFSDPIMSVELRFQSPIVVDDEGWPVLPEGYFWRVEEIAFGDGALFVVLRKPAWFGWTKVVSRLRLDVPNNVQAASTAVEMAVRLRLWYSNDLSRSVVQENEK